MTSYANPKDDQDLYEGDGSAMAHTHHYHDHEPLSHSHDGGSQPHGFYHHIEDDFGPQDRPAFLEPVAARQLLPEIRFQDSRDYPEGGSVLVTSRGHGETHTEFALAGLLELRRLTEARIAELQSRKS
jgi:hypothetical protein